MYKRQALACIAGIVNVVAILGFVHQGLTHMTGITTLLGARLAQARWDAALDIGMVILAFFAGAVFSGVLIRDSIMELRRRYGVALLVESALLLGAAALFNGQDIKGPLLAAAAMGLQNAMATTYSDALIRTTHVSGLFTDVGIAIGQALRGAPWQRTRFILALFTIGAFLTGGIAGALLFAQWSYHALYVPAAWTGLVGLGYLAWQHQRMGSHA